LAVVVVFTVKKRAQFVRMRKIEKQTKINFVIMNQTERRKFYRKDTDIQTERFTVNRQTEVLDERKSNMN
jgi:hypothetical protein